VKPCVAALLIGFLSAPAIADDLPVFSLRLQDHAFNPSTLTVPAGKAFKIKLSNADATPAEFESKELRFEKVVAGNSQIQVSVKALEPGNYQFYDEYHEDDAVGHVIAK
jgi:cupredoxin-like protein